MGEEEIHISFTIPLIMAAGKKNDTAQGLPPGTDLKEFRKTNEAIGLRVSEGRLSLLSRKILNVMVYHAQQLRVPGLNAPIDTEAAKSYFWIPLADVARDAKYDSNDTELLKQHIQEMQNIRILMEDDVQWTSERLVSSVKLVNPAGLKKRGGQLWFGYAFPPEMASIVLNPSAYTNLSFYYQALFRSGTSLALYEICRRYATNPSKVTYRKNWEWWYGAVTGNPPNESVPQYKYFKRDVLKPAIAEINSVTDIQVELIEHKHGRKVYELQFKVIMKQQTSLKFPTPPVIDAELISRMVLLGTTQEEAANLLATTEEAKLRATVEMVEKRMRSKSSPALDSPVAYFKQALRGGYAPAIEVAKKTVEKQAATATSKNAIEEIRQQYLIERAKDAYALYQEMDKADQDTWLSDFKESRDAKGINLTRGLSNQSARTAFSMWFAEKQWPKPTDTDLLEFMAAQRQP